MGLLLERSEKGGDVTVKKIIPGGAVDEDGRLKLKDVLLRVDGKAVDNLINETFSETGGGSIGPPPAKPCVSVCILAETTDCFVLSDS